MSGFRTPQEALSRCHTSGASSSVRPRGPGISYLPEPTPGPRQKLCGASTAGVNSAVLLGLGPGMPVRVGGVSLGSPRSTVPGSPAGAGLGAPAGAGR